jgi:hypothetical protein
MSAAKATPPKTKRNLRPRPPIVVAVAHVSQLNVEPVFGINAGRYLEVLAAHPEVPRAELGKLRLVAVDDMRALLDRIASSTDEDDGGRDRVDVEEQPSTAAEVLRLLGRRSA